MPDDKASVPEPLLSLDFVFDAGLSKIEEQARNHDAVDVKMGVLIAFFGALVAGFVAALFASEPSKVRALLSLPAMAGLAIVAVLVILALYFSFQAFRMRHFYTEIKFRDLIDWTNEEVKNTKSAFLPTLLEATKLNEHQLQVKQQNAKRAVWVSLLGLVFLLATAVAIVVGLEKAVTTPPGVRSPVSGVRP
jgi:hypothetical protein